MTKKYKNFKLIRFLVIVGAIFGLVYIISGFLSLIDPSLGFMPIIMGGVHPVLGPLVTYIIGSFVVFFTFLVGIKPGKLLPFHWLVFFILGILLVVFGADIISCAFLIIAGLIGLIESL